MFNAGGGSATLLISDNTNITLSLKVNMSNNSMSQDTLYEHVSVPFDESECV